MAKFKCTFVLFFCILCSGRLFAQAVKGHDEQVLRVVRAAMSDTTNRFFMTKQDTLKSVVVAYNKGYPAVVVLFLKDSILRRYFDFSLIGDRYFFSKKYGEIQFLDAVSIDKIPWSENLNAVALTSTTFDGDSVVCYGAIGPPHLLWADMSLGTPMRYRGDLKSLAKRIEQSRWKIGAGTVVDSALVFEGTVTKGYELKDLRLVLGEESVFSDLAAHVLLEKEDAGFASWPKKAGWYPATNRIRPLEVRSRIFVRLEPDGSITIETPRNLWAMQGY